jgi:hypothetical protein
MRSLLVAVVALSVVACGDTYVTVPVAPSTLPSPGTVAAVRAVVEFRAIGTPTNVRIRYSSPADGLNQIVTTLPWSGAFDTTTDSLFLSLDGQPLAFDLFSSSPPFFAIQIVVNGSLFREATSSDFLFNALQVSGTWRR